MLRSLRYLDKFNTVCLLWAMSVTTYSGLANAGSFCDRLTRMVTQSVAHAIQAPDIEKVPELKITKESLPNAPISSFNPVLVHGKNYFNGFYQVTGGSSVSLITATHRGDTLRKPTPKYTHNEDAVGLIPLFDQNHKAGGFSIVVADGMGGPGGGDVASEVVLKTYDQMLGQGYTAPEIVPLIPAEIFRRFENDQAQGLNVSNQMGATAVFAEFENGWLSITHIGDSRAVVFRNNKIFHKTEDDSYVRSQGISEEEAMNHPERHLITRALKIQKGGPGPSYELTPTKIKLEENDYVVIATDGLWDYVSSSEVNQVITKFDDPDEVKWELLKLISDRSGTDNITIVVVRYKALAS